MNNENKARGVFVTRQHLKLCGSPTTALFLAQLVYWSETDFVENRQGWFYKSRTEWAEETGLSRYRQEQARTWLRDMGLLVESRERTNTGIRIWFWLNQALLNTCVPSMALN